MDSRENAPTRKRKRARKSDNRGPIYINKAITKGGDLNRIDQNWSLDKHELALKSLEVSPLEQRLVQIFQEQKEELELPLVAEIPQRSFSKLSKIFRKLHYKAKLAFATAPWCRPVFTRDTFCLDDFEMVRFLASGHYGRVWMAKYKHTGMKVAIKKIEKKAVLVGNQLKSLSSEKNIMLNLRFPFLVAMYFHFQDSNHIYFGMEYFEEGELFGHINSSKGLDDDYVRFYSSQVVLALEYLHNMGIVYRDLKPENILLNKNGYVKLCDFGFAKKIGSTRTFTRCGTLEYMSPEVIQKKGYAYDADWWAVGVLMYEMKAGRTPFSYPAEPTKEMVFDLTFPPQFGRSLTRIIEAFLHSDIDQRLGCTDGKVDSIRQHIFYASIDWVALLNQHYVALVPPKVNNLDTNMEEFKRNQPNRVEVVSFNDELFAEF